MKVAVGGTFSPLHAGHTYLLKKTLKIGDQVVIGLTSDAMVQKEVKNYEARRKNLENYLDKLEFSTNYRIQKIEDKYGPAVEEEFDAIVVSPETREVAEEINKERADEGLSLLKIVVSDYILAEDWKPISSTRIRKGEINENGKILKSE